MDGVESARTPIHWRHSLQYNPVDQASALLCGQLVTVVPPKLSIRAEDKSNPRGEERIFLCYYERHGIMDGSILTISLKSALTGGSMYMNRTRDFRSPAAITFPLRQAREWQSWLISAKLWTRASSQQLRDEVDAMVQQGKNYRPKIEFETPKSIQEAADKNNIWQPEISVIQDEAIVADVTGESIEQIEYAPSDGEEDSANAASSDSPVQVLESSIHVHEQPILDSANTVELKQTALVDKKLELERLSQYGGGFDASGRVVPYRASNPRSGLKRPRDQLPEFWNLATENQKQTIENQNSTKRNKLREDIEKLQTDINNMRAGVALEIYRNSNLQESLVIPSLKGFVGQYVGSGGSGGPYGNPGGACEQTSFESVSESCSSHSAFLDVGRGKTLVTETSASSGVNAWRGRAARTEPCHVSCSAQWQPSLRPVLKAFDSKPSNISARPLKDLKGQPTVMLRCCHCANPCAHGPGTEQTLCGSTVHLRCHQAHAANCEACNYGLQ